MKKQYSNFLQNKKTQKLFIFILFIFSFCATYAQPQPAPSLINIPNELSGGSMIEDIIYANEKIYAYSPDSISVYDASNANYSGKVPLSTWGKFNPVYFNPELWPGEANAMTYNETSGMLYAITPNLHLKVINTTNISQNWEIELKVQIGLENTLEGLLETLNGRIVMKYDGSDINHPRLYILVSSRDPDYILNCPGNFHTKRCFLGIYDVDNSKNPNDIDYLILHYSEIYDVDLPQYEYEDQINNFEFNTKQGQDYFYLTRFNRFEIWKIPDNGPVEIIHTENVNSNYFQSFYKFGKMLYINNNQLHKVVIVPYRFGSIDDITGITYTINGDHLDDIIDDDIKEIYAPSRRITDVAYLESSNDLIMSYAPDIDIQQYDPVNLNSDIAVYTYNNSIDEFSFLNSYVTNQPPFYTTVYDTNTSIQMLVVTPTVITDLPNTVLISKKDQIVKFVYDDVAGNYEQPEELLEAENNIFKNGASGDGKNYIINSTAGKLEVFDNTTFEHSFLKTGHPIYHITANANGTNLYLYNKLNVDNTGLYSYNTESETATFLNFSKPIGDCIYNPFQNHFLISKFEQGSAKITVLDASNNDFVAEINLGSNEQYAKEMFVSPDGKLYVMSNMLYSFTPKIFIYDATNYSLLTTNPLPVTGLTCNDDFFCYTAHFCSSPVNEEAEVYVSVCSQEIKSPPYNTETNRLYDYYPATNNNIGKLLRIKDESIINQEEIDFAGKVICPDRSQFGGNSQYDGKVFVIGKYLSVYNTNTNQVVETTQYDFIDISYNAIHDKIFAFTNTPDVNCSENRSCKIWTIDVNSGIKVTRYDIDSIPGQAASFFSNPYNGKVYLHQKIDNKKLGDSEASIHIFDPSDIEPEWQSTSLGITSFSPEYDQTNDPLRSYFYNITTPYINPYTNHIYLPNGGHSCISKVGFSANESMLLNNGDWAWLSFPRLDRDGNDPLPVNTVLSGNIEPNTYPNNYLTESELQNLPPDGDNIVENVYDGTFWDGSQGGLTNIQSILGYKLKLLYNDPPAEKWLHLKGNVLDPDTSIQLYGGKDNWVGYWLYETQSPFDAIPDNVQDELTQVKGQDWCCVKVWQNQQARWLCAVHQSDVEVNYGDMLILKTDSDLSFQWQRYGNPPSSEEKLATEYYQFTEQADYTSFFIELDSTSNPQEIGAFIGDSCVGASTVFESDTIVLIPGYIEGISGEVTFEEYYDSLKSFKPAIKQYFVNNKNGNWEKRTINTNERQDYYIISFKDEKILSNEILDNPAWISCSPNPVKSSSLINYYVPEQSMIRISVYNLYGRELNVLYDGISKSGDFNMQWNGTNSNGQKLAYGVYLIKLKAGKYQAQTKIIIMK